MFDLSLLSQVHRLLLREMFRPLRFELAVVAGEKVHLLVFDVRNACANFIEEVSIVRNNEQYTFVPFQPAFQPEYGRQIQMVSRLVEQQDVGPAHQCPGEIEPHAPATGEFPDWLLVLPGGETEAVQKPGSTRFGAEPVDLLHAFVERY